MSKTKKVRKNKRSLKNKIKSSKYKTKKNLKGGVNLFDSQIWYFLIGLILLVFSNLTSALDINETLQTNVNLQSFFDKKEVDKQSNKIYKFIENFKNGDESINFINNEIISSLNHSFELTNFEKKKITIDQMQLVPYMESKQIDLTTITIPSIYEVKIENSLSIVGNNPTIELLAYGISDMYKNIIQLINEPGGVFINSMLYFIINLYKNENIKLLVHQISSETNNNQLILKNDQLILKGQQDIIIFFQDLIYAIVHHTKIINSKNDTLLIQYYDNLVNFANDKSYAKMVNLLFSSPNYKIPNDDNYKENIIPISNISEITTSLVELNNIIESKNENDINDNFKKIINILKNDKEFIGHIELISNTNNKISNAIEIIKFSDFVCTFIGNCVGNNDKIWIILVIGVLVIFMSKDDKSIVPDSEFIILDSESKDNESNILDNESIMLDDKSREDESIVSDNETVLLDDELKEDESIISDNKTVLLDDKSKEDEMTEYVHDDEFNDDEFDDYELDLLELELDLISDLSESEYGDSEYDDSEEKEDNSEYDDSEEKDDDSEYDDSQKKMMELFDIEFPETPKNTLPNDSKSKYNILTDEKFKKMSEKLKKIFILNKKKEDHDSYVRKLLRWFYQNNPEIIKSSEIKKKINKKIETFKTEGKKIKNEINQLKVILTKDDIKEIKDVEIEMYSEIIDKSNYDKIKNEYIKSSDLVLEITKNIKNEYNYEYHQ